jgi:hypothetical protein
MSLTDGEAVFVTFISLLLISAVAGNVMVVVAVAANRKLRNPTNVLICNLAVSDSILAAIVLPQNVHDISHHDDYFEGDSCFSIYTRLLGLIL